MTFYIVRCASLKIAGVMEQLNKQGYRRRRLGRDMQPLTLLVKEQHRILGPAFQVLFHASLCCQSLAFITLCATRPYRVRRRDLVPLHQSLSG